MENISYADLVNPHIGGIGHLLKATKPNVMRPHGMAIALPLYTPGVTDNYLAETIHGFPINQSAFMVDSLPSADASPRAFAGYDHDRESILCYRGEVTLEESDIKIEYTATEHCAHYRITFPAGGYGAFKLFTQSNDAQVSADGNTLSGYEERAGVKGYFHVELSHTPDTLRCDDKSALLSYAPRQTDFVLEARCAWSYIDAAQAAENLSKELSGVDFQTTVAATKQAWDKALGAVEVLGGSPDQRVTFYTALYRMMNRMQNISEYGRYYSAYDGAVHDNDGHDFYVNDGLWDTYRCAHPLQLLMQEGRQMDMIHSYLRMYSQSGWLPSFPHLQGARNVMLGKHATAMIADTWRKGYRDFDINLAYEAMLKNADQATKMPWTGGEISAYDECYFEKGFFPALPEGEKETLPSHSFERRQSVAVTLEICYDDWCLAQIALELGKQEDYERLIKRAENYRTLYNPDTGFMSPRTADGEWVPNFDPKLSGGQGGRAYFAECNSWTYTWHVQHRIDGLMELMGGAEAFCERLDRHFTEQYDTSKFTFLGQFPDSTGLIGQFCMGNEPSFHIPYLYNYAGKPWKTQRRIREILKLWFHNHPLGICGDEDGGAMSAFYAFSAMGFYPTCPGKPLYDIGSPLFDEVRLHMENGKTFRLIASNQGDKNKYIQSAELNGQPYNSPQLTHEAIAEGGTLVLTMGSRPNTGWGLDSQA